MTIRTRLPYPGLRAFAREESDLFFGRDGCVDAMVDRFAATRFLAVLGPSGSGKSSLVRTGFQDALDLGLHPWAGSRWKVADLHPGGQPMRNLAIALLSTRMGQEPDETDVQMLTAYLGHGPRSILEWASGGNLEPGTNLLLMVDQFEELFRYGDYAQRETAEAFAALLLESAAAPGAPIHVVITMRSEYLGACALIAGLAERINVGLYLTPRMGREECREAIEGPASVLGFKVEPALVNRLLNDLGSFAPWETGEIAEQAERLSRQADQLPVMQHVLNRLYVRANEESAGSSVELKLAEYERIGGLSGALDAHGAEIIAALGAARTVQIEAVFRALVSGTSIALAVRRPCRMSELVELAGGAGDDVAAIVDAFCAAGCNFLRTSHHLLDRDDVIVDISHESLIRQWSLLRGWLSKEWRDGAAWQRIVSAEEHYRQGEGGLLTGLDLQNLSSWWRSVHPTLTWAARHGNNFQRAVAFLETSQKAETDRADTELQRAERERNRLLIYIAGLAAALLISISLGVNSLRERNLARDAQAKATKAETEAKAQAAKASESAKQARANAEESKSNARKSAAFLEGLSDQLYSDESSDLIGTSGLRSQLMGKLLPYQAELSRQNADAIKPETRVLNDYRQAESFRSTGDAKKALDSYRIAYEDGLESIRKLPPGASPNEPLMRSFLQDAYYYAWYLLDIGEKEKGGSVLETTKSVLKQRRFPEESTDFIVAEGRIEHLQARYAVDTNQPKLAQRHERNAAALAERALASPNSGLAAQSFAVNELGDLFGPAKEPEKTDLLAKVCDLADKMQKNGPMNTRTVHARVECLIDQSKEAEAKKNTAVAEEKMQKASDEVSLALRLDPNDPDLLLMAAGIENSLGDFSYRSKQDESGYRHRMAAKDRFVKALTGRDPVQANTRQLRNIFDNCTRVDFPNTEQELEFYREIFKAMTTTLDAFPKSPSFAYIAGTSSVRIGEILAEKKQNQKEAEEYLSKAVMWFDRSGVMRDLSTYSEDFEAYCAAYMQRAALYSIMGRPHDVLSDARKIRSACAPALEKYPWEYYLRTKVIVADLDEGKALFDLKRYKEAVFPLSRASHWGVTSSDLVSMYRNGLGVAKDDKRADELVALSKRQTVAKFSIPVDFGWGGQPVNFYAWDWPPEYTRQFPGIDDQVRLYKEVRATVNPQRVDAVRKLQEIATGSPYYSFPQLCLPGTYTDATEQRYQELVKDKKQAEADKFAQEMADAVEQLVIALQSEPAKIAAQSIYVNRGYHFFATDKAAARTAFDRSAEFAELLPENDAQGLFARMQSFEALGKFDLAAGRIEEAQASYLKAVTAARKNFDIKATTESLKLLRITSEGLISSLVKLKRDGEAESVRKTLIASVATLVQQTHTDEALLEGSQTLWELSDAASEANDQSTARLYLSRARELAEDIKVDNPDGAYGRFVAFEGIGDRYLKSGSPSDARNADFQATESLGRYITFRLATPVRAAKLDNLDLYQLYGELSYLDVEAGRFGEGITAAQSGLKLKPDADWIEANLAHGLLLTGNRDEAIKHYMHARKGTVNGRTIIAATKDDFDQLQKLGFSDPEMASILTQMEQQ